MAALKPCVSLFSRAAITVIFAVWFAFAGLCVLCMLGSKYSSSLSIQCSLVILYFVGVHCGVDCDFIVFTTWVQ